MIRIAIDGMGGDYAPSAVIKGISLLLETCGSDTGIICACTSEGLKQIESDGKMDDLKFVICERFFPMEQKLTLSVFRNKTPQCTK